MISVCIASYNGEKYIKEQIESILEQLYQNDEIIISDDSSTDKTIEILELFNDERIKILKNNKFKSPVYNLENALKIAKGDYIFLADQDDIWEDNKVELSCKALENYDLVLSNATIIDKEGNDLGRKFHKGEIRFSFIKNLISNPYIGCCMAFRKEILNQVLPFPRKIAMHDSWIGLYAQLIGKVIYLDKTLIKYRRHGNNASPSGEISSYSFYFKVSYRVRLVLELVKRIFMVKYGKK